MPKKSGKWKREKSENRVGITGKRLKIFLGGGRKV